MKIEHIAIWVENLEVMKEFYQKYFKASAGEKYTNTIKRFESYFLSFESGSRIEIMCMYGIENALKDVTRQKTGYAHLAMEVKSKEELNQMTEIFRKDGYTIAGEPRITGDGYYESVILDPENNIIELVF